MFECFREHNLKLKLTKCEFFKSKINYLAHHVSKEGIWPSKGNLKAVMEFAPSWTYTEIPPFLGLVEHYRQFIKGFAHIAQPLHEHPSGEGASKRMSKWCSWKMHWVSSRLSRKPASRPLCWILPILTNHSSLKLTQASKDWELCYHRNRWMDNTIQ